MDIYGPNQEHDFLFLGGLHVDNPTLGIMIFVWPSVSNVLVVSGTPLCEQHKYQNFCTDILLYVMTMN